MTDYIVTLAVTHPGTEWFISGNDYATLEWFSDSPKPTQAELDAAWTEVEKQTANKKAENDRRAAFQIEADPLFFGWQRNENTEQAWRDKCDEIRARYPYQ